MRKTTSFTALLPLVATCLLPLQIALAQEKESKQVMITHSLLDVEVKHNGKDVKIMRAQDKSNEIVAFYRKTTRGSIQAMFPFEPHKVETIGEREMIDYIKKMSDGDESIIVIDSRTPAWVERSGMIPGAVNIPFTQFKESSSTLEIMEDQFDVITGETFDYSNAKTLVMYCNGAWCGQSPTAIRKLLAMGYPAAKIKYYRGGMQSWASLGLTVITADKDKKAK
ncbi:MAG TPA: rhodanese-like domain-containing protein [Thiothrix sp.]|nr:rhodanese-like domain-containing protein [Thiothrix sp.]